MPQSSGAMGPDPDLNGNVRGQSLRREQHGTKERDLSACRLEQVSNARSNCTTSQRPVVCRVRLGSGQVTKGLAHQSSRNAPDDRIFACFAVRLLPGSPVVAVIEPGSRRSRSLPSPEQVPAKRILPDHCP